MIYYILLAFLAAILFIAYSTYEGLKTVTYRIESDKVENCIRFVMLSDLHGGKYGKNQSELLKKVKKIAPDAILMPGDIIDDRKRNSNDHGFVRNFGGNFKCYYSTGNHEHRHKNFDYVIAELQESGITVLQNESTKFKIGNTYATISGLNDYLYYLDENKSEQWATELKKLSGSLDKKSFSILLSHHPDFVENYADTDFDLILSGHAHGGQMRLPFINGVYAPGQGLFPKYAGGRYDLKNKNVLIVGRGLSKDHTPRIFNRPEIVVIDVVKKSAVG